jgi:hypothetical protein
VANRDSLWVYLNEIVGFVYKNFLVHAIILGFEPCYLVQLGSLLDLICHFPI